MKRTAILLASVLALAPTSLMAGPTAPPTVPAPLSISPNHETGQPTQSCEDLLNQPGQSINAPGSAFNPDGTGGSVYAGNRDTINNKNTASVSQYDQACAVNQSPQN
jgi:hypothetical protein